jgi:hypothetical protein
MYTVPSRTSTYNCASDQAVDSDPNVEYSRQARGWRFGGSNSCGMTGIVFPNFQSDTNGMPRKPWAGIMKYHSLKGKMTVRGTLKLKRKKNREKVIRKILCMCV